MGERRSRAMLVAVNRDLRALPSVKDSALAELARSLARRVDDGELRAVGELRRTLVELERMARPKPQSRSQIVNPADAAAGQEDASDVLDAIAADRASRRDDLAPRRARRAGAADHDGAGADARSAGDGGA